MKPISIDRPLGAKYHPELKNKFAAENTFKGQTPENARYSCFLGNQGQTSETDLGRSKERDRRILPRVGNMLCAYLEA